MIADLTVRAAELSDISGIEHLLRTQKLPTAGAAGHWRTFVVAYEGERLVGCGGAEVYRTAALIRSIAVDGNHQGQGLGRHIVRQLIDRLTSRGIRDFYLLTTTAAAYFEKRGFTKIERSEVASDVLESEEFRGACPSTAVCMRMRIM